MAHSPATHARSALADLTEKLASALAEDATCASRLSAIELELALNVARLAELRASDPRPASTATAYRGSLLNQRVADLRELRASMVAARAKRRRLIDEMAQRKEAIDAALAVLRENAPASIAEGR